MKSTPLIAKSHLTNALVKLGPLALINQTAAQAPHTRVHHSGLTQTQTLKDGFKGRLLFKTWIQPRRYFLSLRLGRASCSSTWKRSRLPRTKFKEETGAASLRGKVLSYQGMFSGGRDIEEHLHVETQERSGGRSH